ncbi:hypothetical protein CMUS01_08299 [Colletotrichum musicola]|uniref:Uncharacterized protein n=1 Tax=Colletotrichum musicola TaxID=2175873 RepID=A0A8H6KE44_9PEZI|nr:hypothetical protein CMUS01_08299 [Colletotrichum musicola]
MWRASQQPRVALRFEPLQAGGGFPGIVLADHDAAATETARLRVSPGLLFLSSRARLGPHITRRLGSGVLLAGVCRRACVSRFSDSMDHIHSFTHALSRREEGRWTLTASSDHDPAMSESSRAASGRTRVGGRPFRLRPHPGDSAALTLSAQQGSCQWPGGHEKRPRKGRTRNDGEAGQRKPATGTGSGQEVTSDLFPGSESPFGPWDCVKLKTQESIATASRGGPCSRHSDRGCALQSSSVHAVENRAATRAAKATSGRGMQHRKRMSCGEDVAVVGAASCRCATRYLLVRIECHGRQREKAKFHGKIHGLTGSVFAPAAAAVAATAGDDATARQAGTYEQEQKEQEEHALQVATCNPSFRAHTPAAVTFLLTPLNPGRTKSSALSIETLARCHTRRPNRAIRHYTCRPSTGTQYLIVLEFDEDDARKDSALRLRLSHAAGNLTDDP